MEYKGYILLDAYVDDVSVNLTKNIDSLLDAIKNDKRSEWIKKHFTVSSYPTDLKKSSMIHDLLNVVDKTQDIFECENCGRIAIEIRRTNKFKFFSPDSDDNNGILNGS